MMEYEVTPQRQKYLDARGYTILTACPGSGKTTSIVYKLGILTSECLQKYGKYRGIACLSFTNKACCEIKEKYSNIHKRTLSYPNVVCTIDSFITENILLPYWRVCPIMESRPIIVNDEDVLRGIYVMNTGDKEIPICGFQGELASLLHQYNPAKIDIGCSCHIDIGHTCYYYNNKPIRNDLKEYAKQVVRHRLKKGYLNSQDVVWLAAYILKSNPAIASALASRYPYIIVDEAQDTSEMQTQLFDELIRNGLENIEYVGDVCQSIYEWRQASPDNFENLKKRTGWNVLDFTENRRSVQRIIDTYSLLRAKGTPKINSYEVDDMNIPVVVYKYDKTNINVVIHNFMSKCQAKGLSNCHILTRGKGLIRSVHGVTEKMEYWKSIIPYLLIKAINDKLENKYTNAIKHLLHVYAELKFASGQVSEKRDFVKNGHDDISMRASMIELLSKLPSMDESIASWTAKAQNILKEHFSLIIDVDFQPYKKKTGYKMSELRNEPMSKYYGSDNDNIKDNQFQIETIHSSKGASYGGVLLFLRENSMGQSVSLKDFTSKSPMTEKQRLLYVACSRAEQYLAIAIPTKFADKEIKKCLHIQDNQILKIGLQESLF